MADIITISNVNGQVRIRFWYNEKRYSLSPGLKYVDLCRHEKLLLTLRLDIENLCLDETLAKYKLRKPKVAKKEPKLSISELFEQWVTNYKGGSIHKSGYGAIYRMISKWDGSLEDYPSLLGKQPLNSSTYNRRKNSLSKFFEWGVFHKHFKINPLQFVDSRKGVKKKNTARLPLSNEDIIKFLTAIKENTFCSKYRPVPHSYYYPFFHFIFNTGVRNQEAIGLKVKYVDFEANTVLIAEVVAKDHHGGNRARIFKETKTGKNRLLPLNKELRDLLLIQCIDKKPEDLVFPSPQGKIIDAQNLQNRVLKPILKELGIDSRDLYAARHSFATRCLESQLTVANTAYLMGNTPRTIYLHYADVVKKPDSLPEIK